MLTPSPRSWPLTAGIGGPRRRAERIRAGARGWLAFWAGHLDVDALAWEVCELLDDIQTADQTIERAARHATVLWQTYWPQDVLLSVPGVGPICAAATRAWWGSGTQFPSAKEAAAFVGLNPSNWESGLLASPSRPITKMGPPELRLAYYQAADVARRHDPQLAACYRRLMVERNPTTTSRPTPPRPATGLPSLGGAAHRPALPAARPRRHPDRPGHRHRPRGRVDRPRRSPSTHPCPPEAGPSQPLSRQGTTGPVQQPGP
jgi:Transposase IS116/IS110/IS902 family